MSHFALLGFRVGIRWPFWLVAGLLTFGVSAAFPGMIGLLLWVCSVLVLVGSILLHELGHALWQRHLGARHVEIFLDAFGGVSVAHGLPRLTRLQSVLISAAGPGVSIGIGVLLLLIHGSGWYGQGEFLGVLVWVAIYVNLVWGLVNLAPVYPLDGGKIFSVLLGGDPKPVGWTGAVVGGLIGVWMFLNGIFFGGILFFMLAYENYRRANGIPGPSFLGGR